MDIEVPQSHNYAPISALLFFFFFGSSFAKSNLQNRIYYRFPTFLFFYFLYTPPKKARIECNTHFDPIYLSLALKMKENKIIVIFIEYLEIVFFYHLIWNLWCPIYTNCFLFIFIFLLSPYTIITLYHYKNWYIFLGITNCIYPHFLLNY